MKPLIKYLRAHNINTIACCCGHRKYPMTIVIKDACGVFELLSGTPILRTRRFYKRDSEGYYYIPEVQI